MSPRSRAELVRLLTERSVPSVTVVEWWPASRRHRWFHRVTSRAWIVSDVVETGNGTPKPGTALGSDGHLHGFTWKTDLTRRRNPVLHRVMGPKRVSATKLFPGGCVQYVPTPTWESDADVDEFCRRVGLLDEPGSTPV